MRIGKSPKHLQTYVKSYKSAKSGVDGARWVAGARLWLRGLPLLIARHAGMVMLVMAMVVVGVMQWLVVVVVISVVVVSLTRAVLRRHPIFAACYVVLGHVSVFQL